MPTRISRRRSAVRWPSLMAVLLGLLAGHGAARAEPRPEGETFTVFSRAAVTRFPDVAHDPVDDVFLVVSGQEGITARFVSSSGVDGDAFEVSTDPMAYSPRVAATGGAFVVCWLVESSAAVLCRSVARDSPSSLGPEQVLTSGTVGHLESAPSLGCSRSASECLVTWVDAPDLGIRGRRIGFDAAPIGDIVDIAVTDGVFEAFPAVAAADSLGEYLVAYTREPSEASMAIAVQRLSVGTAALVGTSSEAYASTGLNNYPELAHDPDRQRYLAISWFHEGNPDVAGRLIDAQGGPIGDRIAVAATPGFEGGDGIGLAFDVAADSYLAVFQGPETPGQAQQVWAAPVSGDGLPGAELQVTTGPVTKGVYQPRVASDGAGRFLVVTVVDYQRIDGQLVSLDVVEGGSGGDGGGASATAAGSGGGDGGDAGSGPSASEGDNGCGCRMVQRSRPRWLAAMAIFLAGLVHCRRSRRR